MIRPVTQADFDAVLAFWNPVIRDTTVTFSSEEKTLDGLAAMVAARRAAGQDFLVAEAAGAVAGFVTWGQFRAGNGYVHAMEHTIILAPRARGRGLGRALMEAAETRARAGSAHLMVGGISAENDAGIAFHTALGYAQAGRITQAGR